MIVRGQAMGPASGVSKPFGRTSTITQELQRVVGKLVEETSTALQVGCA